MATQAQGCKCGGVLHYANFPRKPRGCPKEFLADFEFRFSFCCADCRLRTTPESVRFLGRRVYLAVLVVLLSARRAGPTAATTQLCQRLHVPLATIKRWQMWWQQSFPVTPLWQAQCARFMPPVQTADLPASLIERFMASAEESMVRFLRFLAPLTTRQ